MYNKIILKTKITFYSDKARDFHTSKMPKAGTNYIFLLVILIDSVL